MKKLCTLLIILTISLTANTQSFRSLIIHSDLIVRGETVWDKSKLKNDYSRIYDKFRLCEVIKGETESTELLYTAYIEFIYEIVEEGDINTEILFLREEKKHYYLIGHYSIDCIKPIKEMIEINKVSYSKERFSRTLEWYLNILESGVLHENFTAYCDLHENSSFYNYYKEKGYFKSIDSVFSNNQKKRILDKLMTIEKWSYDECRFAKIIYKDYQKEIQNYILKMLKNYYIHSKYLSEYYIGNVMEIMEDENNSEVIQKLKKDLYRDTDKEEIIIYTIKELEKIITSNQDI